MPRCSNCTGSGKVPDLKHRGPSERPEINCPICKGSGSVSENYILQRQYEDLKKRAGDSFIKKRFDEFVERNRVYLNVV